jgi:hypothetical protein
MKFKWIYDAKIRMLKSENLDKDIINGGYFKLIVDPEMHYFTISNGARITVCNADYPKGYRNSVRESVLEAEEFWANNRNIVLSNKRSYEC